MTLSVTPFWGWSPDPAAQPAPLAPIVPVANFATLLDLFEGDRGAVAALLRAALISIEANSTEILADAVRDPVPVTSIIAAAHRLKGTSGTIGADRLVAVGAHIEAAARSTPPAIDTELLHELASAVARISADIGLFTGGPRLPP